MNESVQTALKKLPFSCLKMYRYGRLLRAMLANQVAWVRGRLHARRITKENGLASFALAIKATRMADARANP